MWKLPSRNYDSDLWIRISSSRVMLNGIVMTTDGSASRFARSHVYNVSYITCPLYGNDLSPSRFLNIPRCSMFWNPFSPNPAPPAFGAGTVLPEGNAKYVARSRVQTFCNPDVPPHP